MSLHVLAQGDTGPEVVELQHRLSAAGFAARPDGDFGALTRSALEAFQASRGLEVSGVVDFWTRAALNWPFEVVEPTPIEERLVDISEGSGLPDFAALRADGYTGVIVQLGLGTSKVNPLAERQIAGARVAGLRVETGYCYLRSWEPGNVQAEAFVALGKRFGLDLWIDVEPAKPYDHERGTWPVPTDAPSMYRPIVVACCNMMRVSGAAWGVYGAMYLDALNLPAWVASKPLWAATYGETVRVPRPWTQADIWQHAGDVMVGGAKVDLNRVLLAGGMAKVREKMRG